MNTGFVPAYVGVSQESRDKSLEPAENRCPENSRPSTLAHDVQRQVTTYVQQPHCETSSDQSLPTCSDSAHVNRAKLNLSQTHQPGCQRTNPQDNHEVLVAGGRNYHIGRARNVNPRKTELPRQEHHRPCGRCRAGAASWPLADQIRLCCWNSGIRRRILLSQLTRREAGFMWTRPLTSGCANHLKGSEREAILVCRRAVDDGFPCGGMRTTACRSEGWSDATDDASGRCGHAAGW